MPPCRHVVFVADAYRRSAGGIAARGRGFVVLGVAFLVAAAAVAAAQLTEPMTLGWWLVAYLSLVGGVAQLLLGAGLIELGARSGTGTIDGAPLVAELVLWNAGTLLVAASDLARMPLGVVAGSVLLFAALWLFARGLRRTMARATRPMQWWTLGYAVLLVFLAISVVVGTALAYMPR